MEKTQNSQEQYGFTEEELRRMEEGASGIIEEMPVAFKESCPFALESTVSFYSPKACQTSNPVRLMKIGGEVWEICDCTKCHKQYRMSKEPFLSVGKEVKKVLEGFADPERSWKIVTREDLSKREEKKKRRERAMKKEEEEKAEEERKEWEEIEKARKEWGEKEKKRREEDEKDGEPWVW